MKISKKGQSNKFKNYKNNRKIAMLMLFIMTGLIMLALLLCKIFIFGLSANEFLDNVIGNMLGILPPILIFNFAYERITRESTSAEISEQITDTLMSNPETVELFSREQRINFINATIASLVNDDEEKMVQGAIEPYLDSSYNVKNSYFYEFLILDIGDNLIFHKDKYMMVHENLEYDRTFVNNDDETNMPQRFKVGFFVDIEGLDKQLRETKFNRNTAPNTNVKNVDKDPEIPFIFREKLQIDIAEFDKLSKLDEQQKYSFIEKFIGLSVLIDHKKAQIVSIQVNANDIEIELSSSHQINQKKHKVEIAFEMPQLRNRSEILVSINEPTKAPRIVLTYPKEAMHVSVFPFLNDGSESLVENVLQKESGRCSIYMQDCWIYPGSGVIFTLESIQNN